MELEGVDGNGKQYKRSSQKCVAMCCDCIKEAGCCAQVVRNQGKGSKDIERCLNIRVKQANVFK